MLVEASPLNSNSEGFQMAKRFVNMFRKAFDSNQVIFLRVKGN